MLQFLLLILGWAAAIAGVAMFSIPAALILGGITLAVFALLWDFGGDQ